KDICDLLAREGFVAFAPDLYKGKTISTIEEAEKQLSQNDAEYMQDIVSGALTYLRAHTAVRGEAVGALGFSLGGSWAIGLSTEMPADIAAVVFFYTTGGGDFSAARAVYLGHLGDNDEFEPEEGVHEMEQTMRAAGRDVTIYIYSGAKHWFAEPDRPEYDPQAAKLAWQRTFAFLNETLR
ncbi:MAG TPA: dienelactone hydrolase family protein, partial [Roseiflexaceae bacterium]|nr:dienelactone hydrolase family protein [Roseiflexaceae bacterium]